MSKILKNNTAEDISLDVGHVVPASGQYTIDPANYLLFANSADVLTLLASGDLIYNDGASDLELSPAIDHLKGMFPLHIDADVSSTPPFAQPLHRTKRSAIAAPVTCAKNAATDVEYLLPYDKYCKGGVLIVKNADFGDYVEAKVYDKDSVIPEAYRSALCEDWPTVSTYIEKEFVEYLGATYTVHKIRTDPLTARITTGLYVRLTYHAIDSGVDRVVLMNCDMTKEIA